MSWNDIRNDLHLTSSGVGHQLQSPLKFPPVGFKRTVGNRLPPLLAKSETLDGFYRSTTKGDFLRHKPKSKEMCNEIMNKAPGHWKVGYTEDTIKKVTVNPQRHQLTMGNAHSEMKAQFTGAPGIRLDTMFSKDLQPQNYRQHHTGGPVKNLIPSGYNPKLAGENYFIQDRGVLSYHKADYLTTTHANHRHFTRNELAAYPRKEYATYWECEGYPKAWGHGANTNPLPPDSVQREDARANSKRAPKARLPERFEPVRNLGMRSEACSNFTQPTNAQREDLFKCPVPKPYTIKSGTKDQVFSIPKMYRSEYEYYGGSRPAKIV